MKIFCDFKRHVMWCVSL